MMKFKSRWPYVAVMTVCHTVLVLGQPPARGKNGAPGLQSSTATISHAELLAKVESLREEDVAWRKIDWKTCLLDGLDQSSKENKPLILWVFIDRPTDDERC